MFRCFGVLGFRCSGFVCLCVQVFRCLGVWGVWGVWVFGVWVFGVFNCSGFRCLGCSSVHVSWHFGRSKG